MENDARLSLNAQIFIRVMLFVGFISILFIMFIFNFIKTNLIKSRIENTPQFIHEIKQTIKNAKTAIILSYVAIWFIACVFIPPHLP